MKRTYEMITSVRFCLSHDPLKLVSSALKMGNISSRKCIVGTDVVSDVTSTRRSVIHVWSYEFNDTLSTESQLRHVIKSFEK